MRVLDSIPVPKQSICLVESEYSYMQVLCFQFRIMPEDPVLVEWQASFGGEIGRDTGQPRYPVMQAHEAGN